MSEAQVLSGTALGFELLCIPPQVIGVKGPLPPQNDIEQTIAMEINPPHDLGWHHQSVAFIVL